MDDNVRLILSLVIAALMGWWGYNVGAKRRIGGVGGAILGFLLGLIGILITCCFKKEDSGNNNPTEN